MDFKEYLRTLEWRDFAIYPDQGANIYIHCQIEAENLHKFVRVLNFNAVSFDFSKLSQNSPAGHWRYSWLTVKEVEEKYDRNNTGCCA